MGSTSLSSTTKGTDLSVHPTGDKTADQKAAKNSVLDLPEDIQALVRQMLVEGATFEDVFDALSESNDTSLPQRAIESYFRSNPAIQKERITLLLKTAKVLKEALADPKSGHTELAEAVLITGLMGVSRRSASSSLQQAVRIKEQQANQNLKEEAARLRLEKFSMDKKVLTARLKAEETKQELIRIKLSQLTQDLERSGSSRTLGPEIIQQIHEIYGIVSTSDTGTDSHGTANGEA